MRPFLLAAALTLPQLVAAAERSYIHEFYAARKIEKSDPAAATEGMIRSFRMAVAAGNADYATSAGVNGCFLFYKQGKVVETGRLAREVLDALDPLEPDGLDNDANRRTQIFGLYERSLLMAGKIGEAWRVNRAAAETLRGKKVSATADGPAISVADVIGMRPELRSLGWRLIERESELLGFAGRSVEARAMLDQAAAFLGDDWHLRLAPVEQFHAFKLLATRAQLLDFLGYQRDSLQAQQELVAVAEGVPDGAASHLNLRLNLLRNLAQWEGPSEKILASAREVGAGLKASGAISAAGVDRLLAKMELDLRDSSEALDAIRADAKRNADLGLWLEASLADRDSLVQRAKKGESGLDGEFIALLNKARALGNKRGEPTLYREYGDYLLERKRPAEAIALFTESLRLTRSFNWTLHEPAILNALFRARFAAGDLVGARATLAELEAFLKAHPELPDYRRVPAEVSRAIALARLGETAAARPAFTRARELAKDLPPYQKRWLTPEEEDRIMNEAPVPAAPVVAELPPLRVQPLEIVSIAAPGDPARTRFTVFNPTAAAIEGHLEITGPGAVAKGGVHLVAGQTTATLKLPMTVAGGSIASLDVTCASGQEVAAAQVRLAWVNPGQAGGPPATWDVTWDPAAARSVVLDASSLEANPFRSVSLFHELAVPTGELTGIPFRLRSPVALRFEYYDSMSQELLAIDANGNGDFTEAGDLHLRGPENVTSAIFPIPLTGKSLTAEVRIFAPDGLPLLSAKSPLLLQAEVYRNHEWTKEAEDTLK